MRFNKTVASQFLQYYRDTINFQSTISYLKNPPTAYQQPPVDLFQRLDLLQSAVDPGSFVDEYQFEAAFQKLVYDAHEGHLSFNAELTSVFYYGNDFAVSSVSMDGVKPPKPYLTGLFPFPSPQAGIRKTRTSLWPTGQAINGE